MPISPQETTKNYLNSIESEVISLVSAIDELLKNPVPPSVTCGSNQAGATVYLINYYKPISYAAQREVIDRYLKAGWAQVEILRNSAARQGDDEYSIRFTVPD